VYNRNGKPEYADEIWAFGVASVTGEGLDEARERVREAMGSAGLAEMATTVSAFTSFTLLVDSTHHGPHTSVKRRFGPTFYVVNFLTRNASVIALLAAICVAGTVAYYRRRS